MIIVAGAAVYLWLMAIYPAILIILVALATSVCIARRLIDFLRGEIQRLTTGDKVAILAAVLLFWAPIAALVLVLMELT